MGSVRRARRTYHRAARLGTGPARRTVASHPDEDDLVALADAVRERNDGLPSLVNGVTAGFSDPSTDFRGVR